MGDGRLRRALIWACLLLIGMLLAACDANVGEVSSTPAQGNGAHTQPVDAIFKEFYQTLGGETVLGPAISSVEVRDNLQCQFTERVLMCFNASATDTSRFSLYPLGRELGIKEDSILTNVSQSPNALVVDGFVIYEKFRPLYNQLFGAHYVGHPLTQLRINQDLHRVEQFFENVGFYQALDDPNGPVYLIPYGAYFCGSNCSYHLDEYWSTIKSSLAEQPFASSIARLGGPEVFGSYLLKPQIAADGNVEQVYTNAIFYASPDDPSRVSLRPLPQMLGYAEQPLASKIVHDQLVFYEIKDGLGHNVPKAFDAFITLHGGRDLSGNPISEVVQLPNQNLYQQCFEHYCLNYNPAAAGAQVQMAPLGKEYVEKFPPPEQAQISNIFSPDRISLLVSADKPTLNDNEEQNIRILVQERDNSQPIERVEATLDLYLRDGRVIRYYLPPTDSDGMSMVTVPPQTGTSNGARFAYKVCLNLPSETPICAQDSYLIWNVIKR